MIGLTKLGIVLLFLAYLLGWFCHAVVFAGTFVALEKWAPRLVRRKRLQLEFWIAAAAAIASLLIPTTMIFLLDNHVPLVLPLIIAGVTLYSDYRNLREKAIEPEHVKGDAAGYIVGLLIIGAVYWLLEKA